eukprot:gnl/TRDRNA2_/TRDRNA2_178098_c0_seq1.p1 gnl/TRDRNA2_/TRDRNA2_178098_c0~~gnl/TRDRNA2_/TRDRNA2_178098_c0_seq1.p1  ORF type:complete len:1002 (+),score=211.18 gnl/TRDRNA2_/TRDRNA2_178098_c0_seq1:64-3069(+)
MQSSLQQKFSPEKVLEGYGRAVGNKPITVFVIGVCMLGLLAGGWGFAEKNKDDFEFVWAVQGSNLEEELKIKRDLHDKDWFPNANLGIFASKEKGGDVLNPRHFDEILDVYLAAFSLNVTTRSGKQYSMYDLCARGSMPDMVGAPVFPCFHPGPLQCFSEMFETLHPSYQAVDPIANSLFGPALAAVPYSTRPSYREIGSEGIKAEMSKVRDVVGNRGCSWYTAMTTLQPKFWAGGETWNTNGTLLEKAEAVQVQFFMEAPKRGKFRLTLAKPELAHEADFAEASELFNIALEELFIAKAKEAQFVDMSFLRIDFDKRINEENEEIPWGRIIIANTLLGLFVNAALANFVRPLRSHTGIGGQALLCVGITTGAAGGAIGWLGIRFNPTMVQCLPFLAMGLGVNDMFVLIMCLSSRGAARIAAEGPQETLAAVFGQAGVGVALTSMCNVASFALGAFIPIPGMADFCLGASVIAAANYFVVMTVFAVFLFLEAKRIGQKQIDPSAITCLCHRSSGCVVNDEGLDTKGWGSSLQELLEKRWLPVLMTSAFSWTMLLSSCVLIAACFWQIAEMEMGIDIADVVSSDSEAHKPLTTLAEHFTTNPIELYYHDVDIPNQQQAILDLLTEIFGVKNIIPNALPPFLAMFYNYVLMAGAAPVPEPPNTTFADLGWTLEPSAGSHPLYAPLGVANPKKFYEMFNEFKKFPVDNPMQAYMPGGNAFVLADLVYVKEFGYGTREKMGKIVLGFDRFFSTGCKTTAEHVALIDEVRGKIEASPLQGKVFPNGVQFTYYEIYRELKGIFWRAFAIDLVVIFVVSAVFLRSPMSAFASTIACGMIVIEIFGISAVLAKFNMITAAALLMSMGLAVDFVVHVVTNFQLSSGSKLQRLTEAVQSTFPAVLLGGFSTLISLVPMAFSQLPFVRLYFFALFATVTGLGLINGLGVLPAMLAVFGSGRAAVMVEEAHSSAPKTLEDGTSQQASADDAYPSILTTPASAAATDKDHIVKI